MKTGKNNLFNRELIQVVLALVLLINVSSTIGQAVDDTYQIINKQSSNKITSLGDVLYVGGSGHNNYSRIQDAIDNSSDTDIVFVFDDMSPYNENLVVDKSISLIGENKETTIIDGNKMDNVVFVSADGVSINRFTIQNCKNDWQYAGVKVSKSNCTLISNNIIKDNLGHGVYILGQNSHNNSVYENMITNNSYGVFIEQSGGNTLSENTITRNGDGIYLVESCYNILSNNTIVNKKTGLHLYRSSNNVISVNILKNNDEGIYLSNCDNNNINNNLIIDNDWFGIWISRSTKNTISKNIISSNVDIGVYVDCSHQNHIEENTIENNDDGIFIECSSYNILRKNNFRNIKFNAYFVANNQSHCKNIWRRNFWERCRFRPYIIPGKMKLKNHELLRINIDWRPLIKPYKTQIKINHLTEEMFFERGKSIDDNKFHITYKNDGDTLYVGGNGPNNYTHIQEAIDAAKNGDTIFVYGNTYYEHIKINKTLNLVGEDKNTTIIDGNVTGDVVSIFADGVNISEFTIQNGHFGILINGTSKHRIKENNIINNLHGISLLASCSNVNICSNNFTENQYSIRLYSSSSIKISYNSFKSYKLHAFFVGTSIAHCKNRWRHNYWGRARILPYPIYGKIKIGKTSIPLVNFDWMPLDQPIR